MPESRAMTFGYIGYLWAMFGCCTLVGVFGGSAAFLYSIGRRRQERGEESTVTVESVGKKSDGEPGGGGAA